MIDMVAGRYALIDPFGSGGSGTVWRAFDGKRGAYCAAKLLRQRDAGELLRFVREQSVRLDHPHIVSPYSWAAEDGTVLIASDLVDGGSLHTLIGDYGPLAEGTVVAVLRQVLAGLAAVHQAELIHRDVKPANVLVRATGTGPLHVVLTDFGLTISRRDARLTQVGMVIGTPGYLPPEVLLGGVPPDPRHDLYAVGRLALTLLHGDEPDGPGLQLCDAIRDRTLRGAIEALQRRDPAERPIDAAAALVLLAGAHEEAEPRSRDGDRVDVLDQLPPLPVGWNATGPCGSSPSAGPGRATIVDVLPTAPRTAPAVRPAPTLGLSAPASSDSLPAPADPDARQPAGPSDAGTPPGPPAQVGSSMPVGPPARVGRPAPDGARSPAGVLKPSPPRSGPGGRRKGRLLAVSAGVVVVLAAGVVLTLRLVGGSPTDDPTGDPTTSPGTVASATQDGLDPTVTRLAGDPCTWQQEGDRLTSAGGVLVCTLADGVYRWQAA